MGNYQVFLVVLFAFVAVFDLSLVDANFHKSMYIFWGGELSSVRSQGDELQLVLHQSSGSGVKSKAAFTYGSIQMLMKLVPGNSAGTVTAYYVSSGGEKQDEIDFEFLGNVSGQPYIIHTNIYAQGNGDKEQQFHPWFDPTTEFHNYTIHWNPWMVVWYVDSVPIRVFRNYQKEGIPYPNKKGMRVYSTLWNADQWATRGGQDKIDWSNAPFVARYRTFRARACKWKGPVSRSRCATNTKANWWTNRVHSRLSYAKEGQMKWVRKNFMIYDYCKDTKRYSGKMPPECSKKQF